MVDKLLWIHLLFRSVNEVYVSKKNVANIAAKLKNS